MRQEVATDPRCGSYLGLRSVDDGQMSLAVGCEERDFSLILSNLSCLQQTRSWESMRSFPDHKLWRALREDGETKRNRLQHRAQGLRLEQFLHEICFHGVLKR